MPLPSGAAYLQRYHPKPSYSTSSGAPRSMDGVDNIAIAPKKLSRLAIGGGIALFKARASALPFVERSEVANRGV